jgi:hypothetical protein
MPGAQQPPQRPLPVDHRLGPVGHGHDRQVVLSGTAVAVAVSTDGPSPVAVVFVGLTRIRFGLSVWRHELRLVMEKDHEFAVRKRALFEVQVLGRFGPRTLSVSQGVDRFRHLNRRYAIRQDI